MFHYDFSLHTLPDLVDLHFTPLVQLKYKAQHVPRRAHIHNCRRKLRTRSFISCGLSQSCYRFGSFTITIQQVLHRGLQLCAGALVVGEHTCRILIGCSMLCSEPERSCFTRLCNFNVSIPEDTTVRFHTSHKYSYKYDIPLHNSQPCMSFKGKHHTSSALYFFIPKLPSPLEVISQKPQQDSVFLTEICSLRAYIKAHCRSMHRTFRFAQNNAA